MRKKDLVATITFGEYDTTTMPRTEHRKCGDDAQLNIAAEALIALSGTPTTKGTAAESIEKSPSDTTDSTAAAPAMATAAATAIYDRNNNHEQPKKQARRNWNAPVNKKKLDRIKKAWHKNCREEKKVCFNKFCNDKNISASTLKRHLNGGVTYIGMSGHPFN